MPDSLLFVRPNRLLIHHFWNSCENYWCKVGHGVGRISATIVSGTLKTCDRGKGGPGGIQAKTPSPLSSRPPRPFTSTLQSTFSGIFNKTDEAKSVLINVLSLQSDGFWQY